MAGSDGKLYLTNPEIEPLDALPVDRHDSLFIGTEPDVDGKLYPVYVKVKGDK